MVSLRGLHGFLTREDMVVLEEASRRKLKYPKVFTATVRCGTCDYKWFYKTAKCPACESAEVIVGKTTTAQGSMRS